MIPGTPAARGAAPAAPPEWVATRERGSTLLLRLYGWWSVWLGRPAGRVILYVIAAYYFVFAPRARTQMLQYLRRALGRTPRAGDRFRLILSFATAIHDRVYLLQERYELFDVTMEGHGLVEKLDARGEAAFLMGAHLGSFEVTRAVGRRRPGVRVAMAMYERNARKVKALFDTLSPQLAIDIIPLGTLDSMLQIGARLQAGIFVGVLGDRSFGAERYERVEFLGSPAWFPTGAMRAAALLRRPVIFMVGLYRGGNRYHVLFEQLADFTRTPRDQREAAVRLAVQRYARILERLCRSDPYNWFNFFDFWQPPAETAVAAGAAGP